MKEGKEIDANVRNVGAYKMQLCTHSSVNLNRMLIVSSLESLREASSG